MKASVAQLIVYLREHGSAQPDDLAALFSVTRRTIRNYVRAANQELEGVAHISSAPARGGYELSVYDPAALDAATDPFRLAAVEALPQTGDERASWLCAELCARTDWVRIEELAAALYISERTVSKDLRRVEERLSSFGLVLEKRPHHGIRVTGPEIARRLCLSGSGLFNAASTSCGASCGEVAAEELLRATPNDTARLALVSDISLAAVAACVDGTLEKSAWSIRPYTHQNLLVHIAIAIMRVRAGAYVPLAIEDIARMREGAEYGVAREVARALADTFHIKLPEEEVAYISMHLAGKQQLELAPPDGVLAPGIANDAWEVATAMIEAVWHDFRIDFRRDIELRVNLAQHLVPLAARLRYGMEMGNPLIGDIKRHYPLAWSMAYASSSVLEREWGAMPSDDEVGYVALAFALAIERQKSEPVKWNVAVVCASGAGTARLLEWRIKREFSDHLAEVTVCDVAQVRGIDSASIDYIFTTVPLPWKPKVPVCQITCFFDEGDISRVKAFFADHTAPASSVERFFSSELFFTDLCAGDKTELIEALCERVAAHRAVPDDFTALVLEREALMPSAMGGLVAMPHPVRPVSESTFAAVAVLDAPLDWSGRAVRLVLLVSVSTKGIEEEGLKDFYETVSRMLIDPQAIQALLEKPRFETLAAQIRSFSSTR